MIENGTANARIWSKNSIILSLEELNWHRINTWEQFTVLFLTFNLYRAWGQVNLKDFFSTIQLILLKWIFFFVQSSVLCVTAYKVLMGGNQSQCFFSGSALFLDCCPTQGISGSVPLPFRASPKHFFLHKLLLKSFISLVVVFMTSF